MKMIATQICSIIGGLKTFIETKPINSLINFQSTLPEIVTQAAQFYHIIKGFTKVGMIYKQRNR